MGRRKNKKIIKMKRRNSYFIGSFLLLFAGYLLILFVQSFMQEHVSIYEVNQKQIADSEDLRGIILRDEETVKAEKTGYVNYYVGEGSRLAVTTTVYSIDKSGNVAQEAAKIDTADVTLSEEDTRNIRNDIASFRDNFSLSDYSSIVNFRYNIENTMLELSDVNLEKNLTKIEKASSAKNSFSLVKAKQTGIVSFSSDGLEELKIDQITPKHFREMTDGFKQIRTGKSIKKGSPVYRVVKSEKWSVIVALTREQYQRLSQAEAGTVTVTVKKDGNILTPTIRVFTSDGNYYANLLFDKYMIHYLNNRYLDIKIQFHKAEGLKIPLSSIVKKRCYVVPKKYIKEQDGNRGVFAITYTKTGEEEITFIPAEIYWRDEHGNAYIDAALLDAGTSLAGKKDGTGKKRQLTFTKELEGVYNCNQGYCQFRYINKLYQNQEYAVVEKGNLYSLSNFDHIVLNPDKIDENDIIY